jgi:hypothetical protein
MARQGAHKVLVRICWAKGSESAIVARLNGLSGEKKYFNYFVFNFVDCGLPRSGARYHLAPAISSISATHSQATQQSNNARSLDDNFVSAVILRQQLAILYDFERFYTAPDKS